ncbi:unnamed protein product, partial [Rotaria sordida]
FEGIAYNSLTDTNFIIQETISSNLSLSEYNSNVFEIRITTDDLLTSISLIESCNVMWTFDSTNFCQWVLVGIINLPSNLKFLDYSAVSTYSQKSSTYIAITSQENSQVWIGIVEEIDQCPFFHITSTEKTDVHNLPRTIVNGSICQIEYCNIEGVS